MEESRTEYHCHHEENGDSRIQCVIDDSKHEGLAESADESKDVSDVIELPNLQPVQHMYAGGAENRTLVENGSSRLKLPIKA